jgi:hypothetical protein
MARIAGAKKLGLMVRTVHWFVRRKLGKVTTPMLITSHHPKLFMAYARFEQAFQGSHRVDARVKLLAQVRTGTLIGCPF